jgi:broad specificity phosphatase PhoE
MTIYYIRHGQSLANVAKIYPPNENTPLSQRGRDQAERSIGSAKKAGIVEIITSDYPRAFETATIIAAGLKLAATAFKTTENLREVSLGKLMGQPSQGVSGYVAALESGDTTLESIEHVQDRILNVLNTLSTTNRPVLLVGHNLLFTIMTAYFSKRALTSIPMIPNATLLKFPSEWESALL